MQPKTPRWLENVADYAAFVLEQTAGRTLAEYEVERSRVANGGEGKA